MEAGLSAQCLYTLNYLSDSADPCVRAVYGYGRSLAGIMGSNPTEFVDVCLLR